MTYEEKMRALAWVKKDKKDEIFHKILRGDKSVDITGDKDIFNQVNIDRLPIEKIMDRDKYKPIAQHAKTTRDIVKDGHRLKYKGEIPLDIWLTHPWFSPLLDKKERDANIDKFFRLFPDFTGR